MNGQCQINNFTYFLEMRKQNGMVRGMVRVKSTSSHTDWKQESKLECSEAWWESNQQVHIPSGNEKAKGNGQMNGQSQINKLTYNLEMRKQDRWSDTWSESHQQVHIQPGNEKARLNGQRHGLSQRKKFRYRLEMRKQDGMVRGMVRVKSTSSHTIWNKKTRHNSQRSMCQINNFTYCLENVKVRQH